MHLISRVETLAFTTKTIPICTCSTREKAEELVERNLRYYDTDHPIKNIIMMAIGELIPTYHQLFSYVLHSDKIDQAVTETCNSLGLIDHTIFKRLISYSKPSEKEKIRYIIDKIAYRG